MKLRMLQMLAYLVIITATAFYSSELNTADAQDGAKSESDYSRYNVPAMVLTQGTPYTDQEWSMSYNFPRGFIQEYRVKDYRITDLTYIQGQWVVVMTKNSGYTGFQVSIGPSEVFPENSIDAHWNYACITNVAYGRGGWVVVMTEHPKGYVTQAYWPPSRSFPRNFIENYRQNYRISHVAYGDGHWVVVMTKSLGYKGKQAYKLADDYPSAFVSAYQDRRYYVTNVVSSPSKFLVIMTPVKGYRDQSFHPYVQSRTTLNRNEAFRSDWQGGFRLTALLQ